MTGDFLLQTSLSKFPTVNMSFLRKLNRILYTFFKGSDVSQFVGD